MPVNEWKTAWSRIPERPRRALKLVIGAVIGGAVGYAYAATIGCAGGG